MDARLRTFGDRWPWLGRALDVQERFTEINGNFVSAGITVSVFTAIFPLLLVAIAVIGFLASGDDQWTSRIIDNLGLTGSAADTVKTAIAKASQSRKAASVVGLLGLAWSGSGVAVALQRGVRTPWQERSVGIKDRLLGFVWLMTLGVGFAAAIALSSALNWLPDAIPAVVAYLVAIVVGVLIEIGLFLWMLWGLSTRTVPARRLLPGAVFAGIGFEVLKLVGTLYVPRLVANSSSLYGPLGIVFAILAWLALFARLIVYASTLNVVNHEAAFGTDTFPQLAPRLEGRELVAVTRAGLTVAATDKDAPQVLAADQADGADGADESR